MVLGVFVAVGSMSRYDTSTILLRSMFLNTRQHRTFPRDCVVLLCVGDACRQSDVNRRWHPGVRSFMYEQCAMSYTRAISLSICLPLYVCHADDRYVTAMSHTTAVLHMSVRPSVRISVTVCFAVLTACYVTTFTYYGIDSVHCMLTMLTTHCSGIWQTPSAVNTANIQWQTDRWRTRSGCRPRLPACGSPTHGSGIWSAYSCGWDAWVGCVRV